MDILLVEDNPGDILLIKTTIEEQEDIDVNFIVKTNGMTASDFISKAENALDLIILDLNLPHKNGFEILSEILNNNIFKTVPVVVFTSSGNQIDTVKALSMGAKAYIIKPIDLEEYKVKVISCLKYIRK